MILIVIYFEIVENKKVDKFCINRKNLSYIVYIYVLVYECVQFSQVLEYELV